MVEMCYLNGLALGAKRPLYFFEHPLCAKWLSAMSVCFLTTVSEIMLLTLSGDVEGPKVGLCHVSLFFSKRFSVFYANQGIRLAAHVPHNCGNLMKIRPKICFA